MNTEGFAEERSNASHAKVKLSSILKREKGLKKKIHELATLCGVEACLISFGPNRDRPETWPEDSSEFISVIRRYQNHGLSEKQNRNISLQAFLKPKIEKLQSELEEKKQQNRELIYPSWVRQLNYFSEQSLRDLICSLDSKLKAVKQRIDKLKGQKDYCEEEEEKTLQEEMDEMENLKETEDTETRVLKAIRVFPNMMKNLVVLAMADKIYKLTPETFAEKEREYRLTLETLQREGIPVESMVTRIDSLAEILKNRSARQSQIVETRQKLERMRLLISEQEAELAQRERRATDGLSQEFCALAQKPL